MYTYQHQLEALHITAPVRHLRWLKGDLTALAIHRPELQKLPPLPQTLTTLEVNGTGLTSLAGVEKLPQLTTLDLRNTRITSIKMLSLMVRSNFEGFRKWW